jgi:hypothetical protein
MAALAVLCTCLTAQAQGPMVVTDKDDYAPGETALFSATGFQPFELLDFSIAVADDNGLWIPDVAWADLPADASGAAEIEYVVPETWLDKTLQLTALGLTSGLMATTTFTDHSPHPVRNVNFATSGLGVATSITITGSRNTPGGTHLVTAFPAVTFTSPGPSANTGSAASDPGTSFTGTWTYSGFPVSVPAVGGTYDLVSVTDPDGTFPCSSGSCFPKSFTTPIGAGTSTVTGTYVFTPTPPANLPPVVTPVNGDVDLGQIVGCLDGNGGFGTSVSVVYSVSQVNANNFNVYATFNGGNQTLIATVNDPDGNLQAVNIVANPASDTLTFTGPGTDTQTYSTSVKATDDDNASDTEACGGDATVQVTYNFNGFFSPLSMSATTKVKRGSGVPVKFSITDCIGTPITTGNHTIDVQFVSGVVPAGDPTVDDAGMSGDEGINFRYDPTGMQWIYNLKTNNTYVVGDTYKIIATLDDETTHEALISIK